MRKEPFISGESLHIYYLWFTCSLLFVARACYVGKLGRLYLIRLSSSAFKKNDNLYEFDKTRKGKYEFLITDRLLGLLVK